MSTRTKRKRGKYHIENPTKDDCLWCSKALSAANAVRCVSCQEAYHKKCAIQCGSIESGALRKCCDPTSSSKCVPSGADAVENKDNYESDKSCSDDSEDDFDTAFENEKSSQITKHDLFLACKSVKNSEKNLIKR